MAAEIEIALFSGRPNPRASMPARDAMALAGDLARLPHRGAPASDGGLGYRGVRVTGLAGGDALTAHAGVVTLERRDGTAEHFADPGRAIERRLIALALAAMPAKERQQLPSVDQLLAY